MDSQPPRRTRSVPMTAVAIPNDWALWRERICNVNPAELVGPVGQGYVAADQRAIGLGTYPGRLRRGTCAAPEARHVRTQGTAT
jgi:hypothetical protein